MPSFASSSMSSYPDLTAFDVSDSDNEEEEESHHDDHPQSDTPFLDYFDPNPCTANFADHEISLGKFMGNGRFTESHQISGFERDLRYSSATIEEEQGRLELSQTAKTKGRRNYALKQVLTGLQSEREIERAALGLTIEANYLSRLDHPNIIKLRGLCQTSCMLDDNVYEYHAIITNRITETLDQRIDHWNSQDTIGKDSDFILHLKTDYAFQIADALSYLHDRRIIFRNLSLSSIGFTTNDTIQLMNFDCVKEIPQGEDYIQDGFKGSQTYAALEVYSGQKYDCKVDCFAWAICFYEMLTQAPAFTSTTNEEALIRDHGWCPSLLSHDYIPDGLLDLLEDSWETNVEERISMKDIRNQLAWILFGDSDDSEETTADNVADFFSNTKRKKDQMENDMSADYLGASYWEDFSACGLDLDESDDGMDLRPARSSETSHRRRRSSMDLFNAATHFSGTKNSFIPSNLLLDAANTAKPAPSSAIPEDKQEVSAEVLVPKLEYTKQYRGLRLETIPPLSFIPSNAKKQSRRRSMQPQRTEMAVCA